MRAIKLDMAIVLMALAFLNSCGDGQKAMKPAEYNTIAVQFPNGKIVRVEQLSDPRDMARGMMFRDALPEDRGLLFYHQQPGFYPYWMYQVKVPLDILWLDAQKRIVQLVHQAPPCPGPQERCPAYGGSFESMYVLELRAGMAKASGLKPGMRIGF